MIDPTKGQPSSSDIDLPTNDWREGGVPKSQTVRSKWQCISKTQIKGWNGHEFFWGYEFNVVTSGSPENETFFGSTPGGSFKITAVGDDLFSVGKFYYIDATPAE